MSGPSATADGSRLSFGVGMTCSGCSGAVERTLGRVPGLKTTTDLSTQRVVVELDDTAKSAGVSYDDVLARIRKTGKPVHWADAGNGSGPVAFTDEGKSQVAALSA